MLKNFGKKKPTPSHIKHKVIPKVEPVVNTAPVSNVVKPPPVKTVAKPENIQKAYMDIMADAKGDLMKDLGKPGANVEEKIAEIAKKAEKDIAKLSIDKGVD